MPPWPAPAPGQPAPCQSAAAASRPPQRPPPLRPAPSARRRRRPRHQSCKCACPSRGHSAGRTPERSGSSGEGRRREEAWLGAAQQQLGCALGRAERMMRAPPKGWGRGARGAGTMTRAPLPAPRPLLRPCPILRSPPPPAHTQRSTFASAASSKSMCTLYTAATRSRSSHRILSRSCTGARQAGRQARGGGKGGRDGSHSRKEPCGRGGAGV